jgi:hypothetical protein
VSYALVFFQRVVGDVKRTLQPFSEAAVHERQVDDVRMDPLVLMSLVYAFCGCDEVCEVWKGKSRYLDRGILAD